MTDQHGERAHRVVQLIVRCHGTNMLLASVAEAKRPGVIEAHFDSRHGELGHNHATVEGYDV